MSCMNTGVFKLRCALQAYKAAAVGIIKEYMASADVAEVAEALKELGQPDLQHIFVKQVSSGCWPQPSLETLLYHIHILALSNTGQASEQVK